MEKWPDVVSQEWAISANQHLDLITSIVLSPDLSLHLLTPTKESLGMSLECGKYQLCVIASGEVHTVLCVLFPQTKQTTFCPWRWCTELGTAYGWLGQIFSPHIEQVAFSEASLGAEKSQRLKNAANRCHTPISLENHVSRKSSTLTQWAVCSDFIGQWNVDIWPAAAPHLW